MKSDELPQVSIPTAMGLKTYWISFRLMPHNGKIAMAMDSGTILVEPMVIIVRHFLVIQHLIEGAA